MSGRNAVLASVGVSVVLLWAVLGGVGVLAQGGAVGAPTHLSHPCGGMAAEPPFQGVSPLALVYVPGDCGWNYGDIGVWQAGGHDYVVLSGYGDLLFYLFNVDDPYAPQLIATQPFTPGSTSSSSVFAWQKNGVPYVSVTVRGISPACGFFIYNVSTPSTPTFVARVQGSDWCTPHEHFVSKDVNGNADYAWLAMSGEAGSGYKVVVLDLSNLAAITETGRYQRPDANGGIFVHDVTVVGDRVYLAHWGGGVIIHDKQTLAHNVNPTPLNPLDSIRPAGFNAHHAWPSSDGNHVYIEDEYITSASIEKVRVYNISNVGAPYYETGIIGPGIAATNRAHNLTVRSLGAGRDLLMVGWYQAGLQGFEVDLRGATPLITHTLEHRLRETTDGYFGNLWGVDTLPCTLRGHPTTCIYGGDLTYGLIVDALGEFPDLDPYAPESAIVDPINGQPLTGCQHVITGTAHDYYSGVARVELSTDNAATWVTATGLLNWSWNWNLTQGGVYTLSARAVDVAGNVQTQITPVAVAVSDCSLTPTATPTVTPTPTMTPVVTSTPTATSTVVPEYLFYLPVMVRE